MTNNRARHEQIVTAARAAFGRLGLSPKNVTPDEYETIRQITESVVLETGCTREAARRNIHRILRARGNYKQAAWGGKRHGAGRHVTTGAADGAFWHCATCGYSESIVRQNCTKCGAPKT
jgi:hypothetical protein